MKKIINKVIIVFAIIMLFALFGVVVTSCTPEKGPSIVDIINKVESISSEYRATLSNSNKLTSITLPIDTDNDELPYYISDGYESVYTKHTASQSYDGLLAVGTMDNIWYPGALLKISYDEAHNNEFN